MKPHVGGKLDGWAGPVVSGDLESIELLSLSSVFMFTLYFTQLVVAKLERSM